MYLFYSHILYGTVCNLHNTLSHLHSVDHLGGRKWELKVSPVIKKEGRKEGRKKPTPINIRAVVHTEQKKQFITRWSDLNLQLCSRKTSLVQLVSCRFPFRMRQTRSGTSPVLVDHVCHSTGLACLCFQEHVSMWAWDIRGVGAVSRAEGDRTPTYSFHYKDPRYVETVRLTGFKWSQMTL